MRLNKILLFILINSFYINFYSMAQSGYFGEDNRKEASELTDVLKTRSQSVVAVVRRHENNHVSGGGYKFSTENGNPLDLKICEDQRFADQNRYSEVVCGGVLISGDLVLTSANCIKQDSDCTSDYSFIFGYTDGQSEFNPRDVYHCQEVLWQKNQNGIQAAIIRLDRPVNARIPVPINIESPMTETQPVVTIGPHAKLSLKTSTGQIKYVAADDPNDPKYSVGTDLDCHDEDSGNAILNQEGQLIGILSSVTELVKAQPTAPIEDVKVTTSLPLAEAVTNELAVNPTPEDSNQKPQTTSDEPKLALSVDKTESIKTESEKISPNADSSSIKNVSTTPFDIASITTETTNNTTDSDTVNTVKPDPAKQEKTCLRWASPSNVEDRSLYEPINDLKKTELAFIPRGCAFTPVTSIIKEISQFLPQYKKEIRTPTAQNK